MENVFCNLITVSVVLRCNGNKNIPFIKFIDHRGKF